MAYPTVQRLLNIMFEKKYVRRDESYRPARYEAAVSEKEAKERFLSHIARSLFGGSPRELILYAIQYGKSSKRDLEEIRKMLDEGKRKG